MGERVTDDHLTLAEAAEILGFSRRTLERWVRSGEITATVGEDGELRIRRREIERMIGWQGREP